MSITFPRGFRAVAVEAAIKKPGRNDLAIIFSDVPAVAAGMFTTNLFAAAPVLYSREILAERDSVRAILVNAGNANAGTGDEGFQNTRKSAQAAAAALGVESADVLIASTGVIGQPLPMDRLLGGIDRAGRRIVAGESHGEEVARAILTTDTVEKVAERSVGAVRIGGIAKGAGMIHPNMATMLSFITTDAALSAAVLRPILRRAVESTFNAISVDNDMSTNDTVFLLANGQAGKTDPDAFEEALTALCRELAMKIVADGEGATKIVTIEVVHAVHDADARLAADAVATSMLVKTALFGNDPNWGRILAAVGRSGAEIDVGKVRIDLAGETVFIDGLPTGTFDPQRMKSREISILIDIGLGEGKRTLYTTDLTREYVSINADYTS